jgi:hypothetical protein
MGLFVVAIWKEVCSFIKLGTIFTFLEGASDQEEISSKTVQKLSLRMSKFYVKSLCKNHFRLSTASPDLSYLTLPLICTTYLYQ